MRNRAQRNRTLTCSAAERERLAQRLISLDSSASVESITDKVINQDVMDSVPFLPSSFVDLLVVDPPYNLTKSYDGRLFRSKTGQAYASWFERTVERLMPLLKATATVYVCSDWRTSNMIFPVLDSVFHVRNRITWEREKGRGAKSNWKNNTEDIWFCTVGEDYFFDLEAVKLKRRVLVPYRTRDGQPKDWKESCNGKYRLTHPSNIWCDITVPFWSMPENTDHPTQKPEKLIAKLVLASSRAGGFVFDPFLGSGTTAVVAKKLGRRFAGVEVSREYCCRAVKRLVIAEQDPTIQGYEDGVFWERNSLGVRPSRSPSKPSNANQGTLFGNPLSSTKAITMR